MNLDAPSQFKLGGDSYKRSADSQGDESSLDNIRAPFRIIKRAKREHDDSQSQVSDESGAYTPRSNSAFSQYVPRKTEDTKVRHMLSSSVAYQSMPAFTD